MDTNYKTFEQSNNDRQLCQEDLIAQVLKEISSVLEAENIPRRYIAQRLGKTGGFISQILSKNRNLTLKTIADICWAIGYVPQFQLRKADQKR